MKPSEYRHHFRTKNDNIIIQRDESEVIVGSIHVPEKYQKKVARGTIVDIGHHVNSDEFIVGRTYVFGLHSGAEFVFGGHPFTVLKPHEVICEEMNGSLTPKPLEMLMIRDDPGLSSNRIVIPDQAHRSTLAGIATITHIGEKIEDYAVDDRVVLAGGIGKRIERGDVIYETLKPAGVLNVILKEPGTSKQQEPQSALRDMTGDEAHMPTEEEHQVMEIEEGDPRGLLR